MRLLLVEDDRNLRGFLRKAFREEGYAVDTAESGDQAVEHALTGEYHCVVLDVMLPDRDGFAVVEELRRRSIVTPILLLTARDELDARVRGLEGGADDYLTKPFDLGELVARLHALLRRASHSDQQSDTMNVGPLTIDTARRLVFVDGERVDLTKREFDLLAVLAENAGVVLSRQRLLELVWGYDFDVDTNVADVFISYLRRKLERDGLPRVIHTVRGIGYVLRDEP
jgi:two-component system, OmpR family, response regulator PrrA